MKCGSFWSWSLGVGLATLPLIGGCLRTAPTAAENNAAAEPPESETIQTAAEPAPEPVAPAPAQADIESAAVTPVPAELVLPENVQPTGPLAELIRLAHTGTTEAQLVAFVANSPSTFNPKADDLIYLKDIGVPESVLTAMLQRDEQLKASSTGVAAAPPAPVPGPEVAAPLPDAAGSVPYAAAPTAVPGPLPEPQPETAMAAPDYAPEPGPLPAEEAAYPEFYDALAPYGSWVDVAGYGYCWQPALTCFNPGWQPYFDSGCWAYTDCGWYWRSEYSWGWAPFHYGRWFHHRQWGWCWKPDSAWGPSWVCWRHDSTHCGWAPLPPGTHYTAGVGLTGNIRQVTQISPDRFRFVDWRYFQGRHLERHGLAPAEATHVYNHTLAVTRIVPTRSGASNIGLAPEAVAAATRVPVTRVTLREFQPGPDTGQRPDRLEASGRSLAVYRPHVTAVPRAQLPTIRQTRVQTPAAPAPLTAAAPASSPSQPRVIGRSPPHAPIILRGPDHPAQVSPSAPAAAVNSSSPRTAGAPTLSRQNPQFATREGEWPERSEAPPTHSRLQTPKAPPWPDNRSSGRSGSYPYGSEERPSARSAPPPAERWNYDARPGYHASSRPAPDEVRGYGSGAPERSHHESAPVERPSHVERSESHASRPDPAPAPAPAAPSHSQSSSSSDHSSRNGR